MRYLVIRRNHIRDFIRTSPIQREEPKITVRNNPFYEAKIPLEHKAICINPIATLSYANHRVVIKNLMDIVI